MTLSKVQKQKQEIYRLSLDEVRIELLSAVEKIVSNTQAMTLSKINKQKTELCLPLQAVQKELVDAIAKLSNDPEAITKTPDGLKNLTDAIRKLKKVSDVIWALRHDGGVHNV